MLHSTVRKDCCSLGLGEVWVIKTNYKLYMLPTLDHFIPFDKLDTSLSKQVTLDFLPALLSDENWNTYFHL